MKYRLLMPALFATSLALPLCAHAENYVGGSIGRSSTDLNTAGSTEAKTADTSFGVFAGYSINEQLSLEASYTNLGKSTQKSGNISGEFHGREVAVSAIAKTIVDNGWIAYARLGVGQVKADVTGSIGSLTSNGSEKSLRFVYGLGAIYKWSDRIQFRGELSRRNARAPDVSGTSVAVPNLSLGVQISF